MSLSVNCTIGPYFPTQFSDGLNDLTCFEGKQAQGLRILLTGRVLEEGNKPTVNSIVEIWQADANGIFRSPADPRSANVDPGFFGWGRARTDTQGWYRFITVLPGTYIDNNLERAPHINVMVLAIGLTRRLVTTVFFGGGMEDPVINCVPHEVRGRLFAVRDKSLDENGLPAFRFDLILRGGDETPFFVD